MRTLTPRVGDVCFQKRADDNVNGKLTPSSSNERQCAYRAFCAFVFRLSRLPVLCQWPFMNRRGAQPTSWLDHALPPPVEEAAFR